MQDFLTTLYEYGISTGFGQFHWSNGVMILIGLLFIFLAVRKGFEPLLLVPIGFGILIGNIPYNPAQVPLSVYDGPVSQHDLGYYQVEIDQILLFGDEEPISFEQYRERHYESQTLESRRDEHVDQLLAQGLTAEQARQRAEQDITAEDIPHFDHHAMMNLIYSSQKIELERFEPIESRLTALRLLEEGKAIMVNEHSTLSSRRSISDTDPPVIVAYASGAVYGSGRALFVPEKRDDDRYSEIWSLKKQDPWNASIFWWLFAGVGLAGIYPPLIFLGIGALTDFGPMLSNPRTLLLGAAAQFGIFGSLLGAIALGFSLPEAASIGIIGGADGPTAIFTCSQLAPDLLGAVALAAYSYMALVPIIQPPIIRALTTREERLIRMPQQKPVSHGVRIMFPIGGFLVTAAIAPGGLPLLGMLFFGNLLKECMVTDRLAKTSQSAFIDIVTILLGITVGAKTSAANFLTMQTIFIFLLGIVAFAVATAAGVIFGKLMNRLSKDPINPMIGAAGVSAVPMAARVVHKCGLQEDPQNFLLMHAMGPNVAGVIGSAVAAGVLLSKLQVL